MSYPYEIDSLFNSEMAATTSSFVFLANSNPTPPTPVPTEPFRVITENFAVTKDNGTTIEQAHTVLEMSPEDWWLFHDNYGDVNTGVVIFTKYSGENWNGDIIIRNKNPETGEVYAGFKATMTDNPEGDPVKYTLCSLQVPLSLEMGDLSDSSIGIQVSIKTYIGDTEITDPDYEPYMDSEFYKEYEATVEEGELPEDTWLWKTNIFATGDSDTPVFYKLCISSVESSEEQTLKNVSEWTITGVYDWEHGEDHILTLTSSSGEFTGTYTQTDGYPSRRRIPIMKNDTLVGEIKILLFNEDGTEYVYPYNNPYDSVFPLTATKI